MKREKRSRGLSPAWVGIVLIGSFMIFLGCDKDDQNPVNSIDPNLNNYPSIKIGNQVWMAENLKVTRYRNGDEISHVTDNSSWNNLSTGAYCNYDHHVGNALTYGVLYNWYAVNDSRNIAPIGWHVPSDEEWKTLEIFLGMSQTQADDVGWRGTHNEGGQLKEMGTSHWQSPNTTASNSIGFTALPGGYRESTGNFSSLGYYAVFWTSSEVDTGYAWLRSMNCIKSQISRNHSFNKKHGFSVRLIKD